MGFSHRDFLAIIYSFSIFLLVAITVYAFVIGYLFRRKNSTAEGFITARGQVSMWRVAWSLYAGAVGAWVITGPATYTPWAGVVGNVMYALSSGLPVLMIAYAGPVIQRQVPHVLSLTDFIGWRYGWVAKSYVVLLCLFNMSIALLAEYTTIGSLFGAYVGSVPAPIIVVVGVLTSAYTIYGGLMVSIYTDTVQGMGSIVFFLIIGIYMAATFRPDLRTPIPCDAYDPDTNPLGFCISGTNLTGWSSIFAMPASLFTATIFSEAMWQRAWASSSPRNLRRGAWIAAAGITLVVFFAGFCGLLAAWAGLLSPDTNMNLYMLQVLTGAVNEYGQVGNWVGVFVVLLAVCMNSSAVDSLQNGLAAAISSHFLKDVPHSLAWTRVAVLLVNVPLVVLGTKNYTVLELFLLGNMLCSTSATPVLIGLIGRLHPYVGGVGMIASCLLSFILTSVFGVHYFYGLQEGDLGFDRDTSRSVAGGMFFTWLGNGYNWEFFAVAIGVSTGAMLMFIAINWAISKTRLRKPAVIGFVAPATHPEAFPKEVADNLSNDDKPKLEKQVSSSPDSQSVEGETVAA